MEIEHLCNKHSQNNEHILSVLEDTEGQQFPHCSNFLHGVRDIRELAESQRFHRFLANASLILPDSPVAGRDRGTRMVPAASSSIRMWLLQTCNYPLINLAGQRTNEEVSVAFLHLLPPDHFFSWKHHGSNHPGSCRRWITVRAMCVTI